MSTIPIQDAQGRTARRWSGWLGGLLLFAGPLVAYGPVLTGQFVWDDLTWTTMPGIDALMRDHSGLIRIWTDPQALQQYYPLTATTFWLDRHAWGLWTTPYHVESVLLHGLSAVLFWLLLRNLRVPGAWLAGGLLAFHPVMVESAGWISERKNVLSLALFLAALLAHAKANGYWSDDRMPAPRRRMPVILAQALAVGALLAKITAVAFAPAALLLCWWKRGRLRWREDVLPLLPFVVIAIALGISAWWMEHHRVGASGPEWDMPFASRCIVAGRALWFYAGKLLWPADLCAVYPRWTPDPFSVADWIFPAGAIAVFVSVWLARGKIGRGPAAAALFYFLALFPVLGFMNVYGMLYSFVADRWVYFSSLGPLALGAALVARTGDRLRWRWLEPLVAALVLPVLAVLTWRQSAQFQNNERLWRTTIEKNPAAWMAPYSLGVALGETGRVEEAAHWYRKAIEIRPDYPDAHNNLGNLLLSKDRIEEAIAEFRAAVAGHPRHSQVEFNFGVALSRAGNLGEAAAHFGRALEINPNDLDSMGNLAWLLATCPDAADRNGARALELARHLQNETPKSNAMVLHILAAACAETGRFEEAAKMADEALALASAQGNEPFASAIREERDLYRDGKPFRDIRPATGTAPPPP